MIGSLNKHIIPPSSSFIFCLLQFHDPCCNLRTLHRGLSTASLSGSLALDDQHKVRNKDGGAFNVNHIIIIFISSIPFHSKTGIKQGWILILDMDMDIGYWVAQKFSAEWLPTQSMQFEARESNIKPFWFSSSYPLSW